MFDYPKYIIVVENGCECAIVFNPILSHRSMAGGMKVIGAGFCALPDAYNKTASAWGESVTLGIKSRGEKDAYWINKLINNS